MAWIESHQSLGSHWKTSQLAAELEISEVQAVGHLHYFWWWCLDHASNGSLTRIPLRAIALNAKWEGDESRFLTALLKAGFVEKRGKGLRIHDWYDYAGKLIERRAKHKETMRQSRDNHGAKTDTSTNRNQPTVPTNQPTGDQPTQPQPTPGGSSDGDQSFERLLSLFNNERQPELPPLKTASKVVLNRFIKEHGSVLVEKAIREASLADKPNLRFVEGILLNWKDEDKR